MPTPPRAPRRARQRMRTGCRGRLASPVSSSSGRPRRSPSCASTRALPPPPLSRAAPLGRRKRRPPTRHSRRRSTAASAASAPASASSSLPSTTPPRVPRRVEGDQPGPRRHLAGHPPVRPLGRRPVFARAQPRAVPGVDGRLAGHPHCRRGQRHVRGGGGRHDGAVQCV
ncbi:hypothetical protein BU14_0255s0025 [Porphyra umbilicalis]|uniref:Uncharacterized protein n=1 Tax=Porphyra umbilicalis TaxID=2786 RepID=A0A1X6P2Q9_PORUM|nr:hypothetical protein BU14_0255s0025 [Porphyra umbilicalis]|eukprot:OSX75118.1 hypothetical protein BU14_0255s0025 [Porphyra umbilicalis]